MSKGLAGADNRGAVELGGMEKVGWDEVVKGATLNPFVGEVANPAFSRPEERNYNAFRRQIRKFNSC